MNWNHYSFHAAKQRTKKKNAAKKTLKQQNASFEKCCKIDVENLGVFCVFYLNSYSRTIYYHTFSDNHIVATDKILKQISFFIKP